MRESDLRLHLAAQGLDPVGLLTSLAYDEAPEALDARLSGAARHGVRVGAAARHNCQRVRDFHGYF